MLQRNRSGSEPHFRSTTSQSAARFARTKFAIVLTVAGITSAVFISAAWQNTRTVVDDSATEIHATVAAQEANSDTISDKDSRNQLALTPYRAPQPDEFPEIGSPERVNGPGELQISLDNAPAFSIFDHDGDNAPPEAEFEELDAATQLAIAAQHPATADEFAQALRDIALDFSAQTEAAVDLAWSYALDHHQERQVISALTSRLQSQDPAVIEHTQRAIADLSNALNVAPTLNEQRDDAAARSYIAMLAQTALTASETQQRFDAIAALGSYSDVNVIPVLSKALNDPDAQNRDQAVRSLGNIARHSDLRENILVLLQRTKHSGDDALAVTVEEVLRELSGSDSS